MRKAMMALGALALSLAGCPKKDDDFTPQINVAPGAATRLLWSNRLRAGAIVAAETSVHPARVHAMVAGEELGGPGATGRAGDLVLENDEVVFVIDRSGSSLLDAADARARIDELARAVMYTGNCSYEKVKSGTTADGGAWILVEAHGEHSLRVRTRYMLEAPDRAMLIETELKNEGDAPSESLSLGDALFWGADAFAPGEPVGFSGPSSGPFVGAIGRATSYAVTSTDGEIEGRSGAKRTDTVQGRDVVLAPGERVQYARVFVVGEKADSASLVAELAKITGESEER
jgi:hypothetical protein